MGEEQQQVPPPGQEELEHALAQFVGESLFLLFPDLGDDRLADLSLKIAHEQIHQVDHEILPTLVGEMARTHPTLVFGLYKADDATVGAQIKCAKQLTPGMEVGLAIQTAAVLSLLHAPQFRAFLRVCGFVYSFAQSAEVLPGTGVKPRIIM